MLPAAEADEALYKAKANLMANKEMVNYLMLHNNLSSFNADVKAELQSRITKFGECFMNKKPEEIVDFYTEDCRVLAPGAPAVQGREGIQVSYNLVMNGLYQCIGSANIGKLRIDRK